jgi:cytochrome c peroxidase
MRLVLLVLLVLFVAFRTSDKFNSHILESWPKPEHEEALDSNQVLLGRMLFYEPMLSSNGMVSCASCHSPYNSFAHTDHALSHGVDDRIGFRNAPALINLAWRKNFMWDGFSKTISEQIMFPVDHPDEMGSSFDSLPDKLRKDGGYSVFFQRAFGDPNINEQRVVKAFTQFLFSLVSANSKYDQVKRREAAFTNQESEGYGVFKQHCAGCHAEPLFADNRYSTNHLPVDTAIKDYGRMRVTGKVSDSLLFRIPTLRNIEYTFPYMHDGRFKSLWQVMDHYQSANLTSHSPKSSSQIIKLSPNEKVDLMAFLLTLSDKEFVFDPEHSYPINAFREKSRYQSKH